MGEFRGHITDFLPCRFYGMLNSEFWIGEGESKGKETGVRKQEQGIRIQETGVREKCCWLRVAG